MVAPPATPTYKTELTTVVSPPVTVLSVTLPSELVVKRVTVLPLTIWFSALNCTMPSTKLALTSIPNSVPLTLPPTLPMLVIGNSPCSSMPRSITASVISPLTVTPPGKPWMELMLAESVIWKLLGLVLKLLPCQLISNLVMEKPSQLGRSSEPDDGVVKVTVKSFPATN